MDVLQVVLRLIHIVCGVFWVGATIFNSAFLLPAMRDAGPDGAKVAAGLAKRHFMEVMPVVAILTMLSGLWLYSRASVGFRPEYLESGAGRFYTLGAVLAIVAFIIGMTVVRTSMVRAMSMMQTGVQGAPDERDRWLAAAQALRTRAAKAGNLVATLLVLATASMAVARYM